MSVATRLSGLRPLWIGPVLIYRWLAAAPLWFKVLFGVLFITATAVFGYYFFHKRVQNRIQREVVECWKQFEMGARRGDKEIMRTALSQIIQITPNDELAKQRLESLNTGEAARNDPAMIVIAMRSNLREQKFPEALREAEKWLATHPQDWLARCVKASSALQAGDREAANRELDALPDPSNQNANVDTSGLLFALQLFRSLDRDLSKLRNFSQNRIVPHLTTPTARSRGAGEKVSLIECYFMGFEPATDKPQPLLLLGVWSNVNKLADLASEESIDPLDITTLQRLGRLTPAFLSAIETFHRHQQISEDQYADFKREIEDRNMRVWQVVRDKSPKSGEAYRNIALGYGRARENLKLRETILQGLEACPDDPDLMHLFSRVLQIDGRAWEAWLEMSQRAKQHPDQPVWWMLAIDAAVAANRRDLALNACQEMRKVSPQNLLVRRVEAQLWVDAGDVHQAVQLLETIDKNDLVRDAIAIRLYVRALADAGLELQIEPLLEIADKAAIQYNQPQIVIGAMRGWLDAKANLERSQIIANRMQGYIRRWDDAPELFRLRAEALTRVAELATPIWDQSNVAAAMLACERFRAKMPDDREIATRIVMLRCYGEKNPTHAFRDSEPLRTSEADPQLTVRDLEMLGMVYRLTNKLPEAIRVLKRATQSNGCPAGAFVQLALTYHRNGQTAEAQTALAEARVRPRNAREQVDYVAAVKTLQGEKP